MQTIDKESLCYKIGYLDGYNSNSINQTILNTREWYLQGYTAGSIDRDMDRTHGKYKLKHLEDSLN